MIKTGLMIAPSLDYLAKLREKVNSQGVRLLISDDNMENVIKTFSEEKIDIVLMGYLDEEYLEIAGHIYRLSPTTTIHALGEGTDSLWFINGILKGLAA